MISVLVGKGRKKKEVVKVAALNALQLANMTELTQIQMFGQVVRERPSDRSIHPNGRVAARKNTKRATVTLKGKQVPIPAGTEPARTRDGQTYPGGRHLRRALRRLSQRQTAVPRGTRTPGSMKG